MCSTPACLLCCRHCISQWGHNFRPDYLRLASFAELSGARATLALTATATEQVTADICSRLSISSSDVIRTPLHRENLQLRAIRAPDRTEERAQLLIRRLKDAARPPGVTIVYVMLQKTATDTADRCAPCIRAVHLAYPFVIARAYCDALPSLSLTG